MPGVLPETAWMSDERVSGVAPCAMAGSATVKSKLPPPWPTSNSTPRFLASSAAGSSLPPCTMLVKRPLTLGAPE